jgi:hypothetical protein
MKRVTPEQEKAWNEYREAAKAQNTEFMLTNSLIQDESGAVKFIERTAQGVKSWIKILPSGEIVREELQ